MKLEDGQIELFDAALYRGQCGICGYELEWEASFDADSPSHHARCCKQYYIMRPETVKLQVWESDDE